MNMPDGSSPDPAQQFPQHNRAATAKDRPRPGFPHQSVHELVELRMGHAIESSKFAA
jgi:hypothetical protein